MAKNERTAAISVETALAKPDLWASDAAPFLPAGQGACDLANYLSLLIKWNKALNLVGHAGIVDILRDLVQDSFFLAPFLEDLRISQNWQNPAIVDMGAGAGFPGIPLRIFWRQGFYTMVDNRQQRVLFLENVIAKLKLEATTVSGTNIEKYLADLPTKPQCLLSRAFRPWQEVLKIAAPYLADNGIALIMANESCPTLPPGWLLVAQTSYQLPHKKRWLWAIRNAHAN